MRVSTPRILTLSVLWVALGTLADLCQAELLPCYYPETLLPRLRDARKRVRRLQQDDTFDWNLQLEHLGVQYVTPATIAQALGVLMSICHGKHYADLDGAREQIHAFCLTPNAQVLVLG